MPVILLVLRRMHAGLVGGYNDKTSVYTVISVACKRVRGNVKADVLHGGETADPSCRRARRNLACDFFVYGPFGVNAVVCGEIFHYFSARRTGISRPDKGPRFVSAAGKRFVAGHNRSAQFCSLLKIPYSLNIMLH